MNLEERGRKTREYSSRDDGWRSSEKPLLREVTHREFLGVMSSQAPVTLGDLQQLAKVQGWQTGSMRWEIDESLWTGEVRQQGSRNGKPTYCLNADFFRVTGLQAKVCVCEVPEQSQKVSAK